jgi:hypothetical protein
MLLLLASYVMAKDNEVDLADYPKTFHVTYQRRPTPVSCIMGLTDEDKHGYVVTTDYGWCFFAGNMLNGNFGKGGRNRSVILLVSPDKKGKLKVHGFTVESESAY